jgi:hypothetical protein
MTDSAPHQNAFLPVIMGWTEPSSMADDRVVSANRTSPRQGIQRDYLGVDVVFRLWQCDKENHAWCEGPPVTVLCQSFRSAGRAFTLRLNQFRTKTRILLYVVGRQPSQNIGRFKTTTRTGGLKDRKNPSGSRAADATA